jgi:hypothetical protein
MSCRVEFVLPEFTSVSNRRSRDIGAHSSYRRRAERISAGSAAVIVTL